MVVDNRVAGDVVAEIRRETLQFTALLQKQLDRNFGHSTFPMLCGTHSPQPLRKETCSNFAACALRD